MRTNAQLTIGELAKQAGVTVETVRFYQRKGLLREPAKPYGGIRRYDLGDRDRLGFVKSAKRLGFSLDEVAELLQIEDGMHCEAASQLAARKLSDVRLRLRELAQLEVSLSRLVEACDANRREEACPLIQSLHQDLEE